MKKIIYIYCFTFLFKFDIFAQVGIGTNIPDSSSVLELKSTTKGMLVPRMTAVQKNNINKPQNGLLIYQTDSIIGFKYYTGTKWTDIQDAVNGLPTGKQGQTLRYNGSNWVADSLVFNDGTDIYLSGYNYDAKGQVIINSKSGQSYIGSGSGDVFLSYGKSSNFKLGYNTNVLNQPKLNLDSNGNMGLGISLYTNPLEKLEVGGGIKLGTTSNSNLGTLRWTGTNLQVYSYGGWKYLDSTINLSWNKLGNSGINSYNDYIGTSDSRSLVFRTNNIERVRFDSLGKVGIGTNNPNTSLHIGTGSDASLSSGSGYLMTGSISASNIIIDDNEIMARSNGVKSILHLQADGGDLIMHNNTTGNKFVFTDAGDMGVGQTTPVEKLDVAGGIRLGNTGNSNLGTLRWTGTNLQVYSYGGWKYLDSSSTSSWNKSGNSGINSYNDYIGTSDSRSLVFRTNNIERVRFDSLGKVGIGTNNPNTSLHIGTGSDASLISGSGYLMTGSISASNIIIDDNEIMARSNGAKSILHLQADGGDLIVHNNTTGNKFVFTDAGDMGVGQTTPAEKLDVAGGIRLGNTTNSNLGTLRWTGTNLQVYSYGGWKYIDSTTNNSWNKTGNSSTSITTNYIGNSDSVSLLFKTNNIERMRITDNGHTYITSPTSQSNFSLFNNTTGNNTLNDGFVAQMNGSDIYLANRENGDMIYYTNNAEQMRLNSKGYLGIATTAPVAPLHVAAKIPNSAVASINTNGNLYGMCIQGNYLYVVDISNDNMQVIDISIPTSPVTISTTSIAGDPYSITISGQYAYVISESSNYLSIIDISNPYAPAIVSSVATGTQPYAIDVQGRYAYIINYTSNTMQIFDIANVKNPLLVGSANTGNSPSSIDVQGRYAYICNLSSGTIQVFDIINPASPTSVGSVSTGSFSQPTAISVQGRYAYVANYLTSSFHVYDMKNPASPKQLCTISTGTYPWAIQVQGHYAYIGCFGSGGGGIDVFDISNPASPTSQGYMSSSDPLALAAQGRYVFCANYSGTVKVFDMGGAYIPNLETGNILADNATIYSSLNVFDDANIKGGLSVGSSAQIIGNVGVNGIIQISTDKNTTLDSGLFSTTAGNIGIGTAAPVSTLEVVGSMGNNISKQTGSTTVTLDNTSTIWYFTGSASITLPTASACTNRRYTIINRNSSSRTVSSYTNLSGSSVTAVGANSSIEIISDGSTWLQIR